MASRSRNSHRGAVSSRKSLNDLLSRPRGRRMVCDRKVNDSSALMRK
jgi:hypothetical protein